MWTDTCPHCEASLPGIEALRRKHADRGLAVVAVYHPKPPRAVDPEAVVQQAADRGYDGVVAIDRDWSELRRAYLDAGGRRATSISILVDAKGIVRFLHPGPRVYPSDDPASAQENADFQLLDKAIESLLK